MRLAVWSSVWNAKPENRNLPSWWEWVGIRLLTKNSDWTQPQRKMMTKATSYHVVRGLVVAVILALVGWGSYEGRGTLQAHALRDRLLDANTTEVPIIVKDMASYRRWLDPLLVDAYARAEADKDARKQLHASLALLSVDPSQVDYLLGRLLDAAPQEVPVIQDALVPHKHGLVERLWTVVEQPDKGKESQRLRAAAALAQYDPDSARWGKSSSKLVEDLVSVNAVYLGHWTEAFRPVKARLLAPLSAVFRDRNPERTTARTLAMNLLVDYAADQPQVLAVLVMDADEKQFAAIYPKLKEQGERGLPVLTGEIDRKWSPNATDEAKNKLAKRQANAAVALLKMNQPAKVWPLLKHRADPRVRSYLIHRFGPLGVDVGLLVKRLGEEPDVTIRRALILSVGPEEFGPQAWTPKGKKLMVQRLQGMYRTAADPGLHAAAEWLLRQWHEQAWIKHTDEAWVKDKKQRQKRLNHIKKELTREKAKAKPQWYVNGQGQTMVVLPGPVEFVMGSPATEAGKLPWEPQHRKRISRTFAIAAKPVTKEQFLRFFPEFSHSMMHKYPEPTCPIGGLAWYGAAAYCNWLNDQEGIPKDQWCYETDKQGRVTKLKENYLSRTGYRLPTEAEWEYSCRAGAATSWYYGATEELLGKYGWYSKNSQERAWAVGSKKPNDLGLFDMHGNVQCWCQERFMDDKAIEDKEDDLEVIPAEPRMLRGGSCIYPASAARSASRHWETLTRRMLDYGFRVARTFH
ncbi:MAG TPA: formylglycine-generating enzyme family protein [Gemmataceae bacterium]|nr:formylglycine-generating enzyme family protein [Gemmataceae bacterium]